jgi:hypothetical protein
LFDRPRISFTGLEAERREAFLEVVRELGGNVDLPPLRRVDPDPSRVKMELPADSTRQESVGTTIFRIADNGVSDCSHVRTQLMRAPGQGLKLDEGRAITGAIKDPPFRLGWQAAFHVDVHFLPACAGLLCKRRINGSLRFLRHAAHDRPIDLSCSPT